MSLRCTIILVLSLVCVISSACAPTNTFETLDMDAVVANQLSKPAEAGNATANDLRKLAEAGNADAQNRLGLLYTAGLGIPQNYERAKRWFTRAAEQGHAGAQVNVGTLYLVGHGFYQSDQQALFWFRNAAEQNEALAFAKLGLLYARGQGVPRDIIQAHMWYNLSAAHRLGQAAELRDALAKQMTPAQIAEAQRLAREWKPRMNKSSQTVP